MKENTMYRKPEVQSLGGAAELVLGLPGVQFVESYTSQGDPICGTLDNFPDDHSCSQ